MNILLWVLQILVGVYFAATGLVHYIVPPNLPGPMQWMYDLPGGLNFISGAAEILGGLGLILPGLTRIQTRLIPLAAAGLVLVMVGAMIYHVMRGEFTNLGMNIILGALSAFVAYGRWKLHPLSDRKSQVAV